MRLKSIVTLNLLLNVARVTYSNGRFKPDNPYPLLFKEVDYLEYELTANKRTNNLYP